jgi:sterol desaturase/sphingolipid hydroxylase (fatty acid hydroxylase superfamily)
MSVSAIRLLLFLGILLLLIVFEYLSPRRSLSQPKVKRWTINFCLHVTNVALVYFTMGAILFTTATAATEARWGILNLLHIPPLLFIPLTILILDFVIYLQHICFHLVPLFWRFHRVHHTDIDFDVTTGIRFHPIEILISLAIKMIAVVLIGADPWGTIIFEIILNATSLFNHANIFIPLPLDEKLRWILVTPDVHRIHHSIFPNETNSNFGFSVTWWDRLCRTYRNQPKQPHTEMEIGLPHYRKPDNLRLFDLLILPALKSD